MITVKIIENGPAILTGIQEDMVGVVYPDKEGQTQMELLKTVVLCRCSKSKSQPYCDGSHKSKEQGLNNQSL